MRVYKHFFLASQHVLRVRGDHNTEKRKGRKIRAHSWSMFVTMSVQREKPIYSHKGIHVHIWAARRWCPGIVSYHDKSGRTVVSPQNRSEDPSPPHEARWLPCSARYSYLVQPHLGKWPWGKLYVDNIIWTAHRFIGLWQGIMHVFWKVHDHVGFRLDCLLSWLNLLWTKVDENPLEQFHQAFPNFFINNVLYSIARTRARPPPPAENNLLRTIDKAKETLELYFFHVYSVLCSNVCKFRSWTGLFYGLCKGNQGRTGKINDKRVSRV